MNNAILFISISTGAVILALIGICVMLHGKYRKAKIDGLKGHILSRIVLGRFYSGQKYLEWYRVYHSHNFKHEEFAEMFYIAASSRLLSAKRWKDIVALRRELGFFHGENKEQSAERLELIKKAVTDHSAYLIVLYKHEIGILSKDPDLTSDKEARHYYDIQQQGNALKQYGVIFPPLEEILKSIKETQPL
jgi:hypothetical protein